MMSKTNAKDENPLWRNYMNSVDMMDNKWLKKVELKIPFSSNSYSVYSEDEFLEKLQTDKEFNKKWGH